MDKKSISDNELRELQCDVATMRRECPKILSTYIKQEGKILLDLLNNTTMELDNNKNIDFKKAEKSYIKKTILETQVKPPNFDEKQMELNKKTDTLLQCIEFLKKP